MIDEGRPLLVSPELVQDVMRQVEHSDIEELDLRWGDARIRIRQDAERPVATAENLGAQAAGQPGTLPVVAPLTGVYYARPSPEQPPFVAPGDSISRGQVVALIETMKLFNEVLSEVDGRITDIGAVDGDLVEKGQPLMHVQALEGVE